MAVHDEHTVVIPAHGLGSRIRDLTGGRPKTLLEVAGRPLLWRLLFAASQVPHTRVVIYAPEQDEAIAEFLGSLDVGCTVELRRMTPQGYIHDMVRISHEVSAPFTVLDSDLVVPLPELKRFIDEAPRCLQDMQLILGVNTKPLMDEPRAIWLRPQETPSGTEYFVITTDVGAPQNLLQAVGAYHWRPSMLRDLEHFASGPSTTFHMFMADLAQRTCKIGGIRFSHALNVNTHAELQAAQAEVLNWRQQGIEELAFIG